MPPHLRPRITRSAGCAEFRAPTGQATRSMSICRTGRPCAAASSTSWRTAPSRWCPIIPSRSVSGPGQRPLMQGLRVRAGGQRLGRLPAPPGQRSLPLLQPCLSEGLVTLEQRAGGVDLGRRVRGRRTPASTPVAVDAGSDAASPRMGRSCSQERNEPPWPGLAHGAAAGHTQCPRHRNGHRLSRDSERCGLPGGSRTWVRLPRGRRERSALVRSALVRKAQKLVISLCVT